MAANAEGNTRADIYREPGDEICQVVEVSLFESADEVPPGYENEFLL